MKTDVNNAILSGLDRGGYDSSQLEYVLKALEYNPWIGSDLKEIEFFSQSLVTWGTRNSVIMVLDDIVDSTVTDITGCTTGEELFNLYVNTMFVDTSHLYEIYRGDSDIYFVCSVI